MRRRLVALFAGVAAAAALALPAAAVNAPTAPAPAGDRPPQVCVWESGVMVGPFWVPVFVPYTCTPIIISEHL